MDPDYDLIILPAFWVFLFRQMSFIVLNLISVLAYHFSTGLLFLFPIFHSIPKPRTWRTWVFLLYFSLVVTHQNSVFFLTKTFAVSHFHLFNISSTPVGPFVSFILITFYVQFILCTLARLLFFFLSLCGFLDWLINLAVLGLRCGMWDL